MLTHTYANFQQLTKKLFEKETITLTPEKKNGVKSTEKKNCEITFVSSVVPSPLAPKSNTSKTAELLSVSPFFGGGAGAGAGDFDPWPPLLPLPPPFWWPLFFPFFLDREDETPLLCRQCLPLLALQESNVENHSRKTRRRVKERLFGLKPLFMFPCVFERESGVLCG